MKYLIFLLFISNTYASLPQYEKPAILARSSYIDGDNMPVSTLYVDSTPSINDQRMIGLPLSVLEGQEVSGVWIYKDFEYRVPYYRLDQFRISNFEIDNNGEFFFTVYDDYFFADLLQGQIKSEDFEFNSLKESLIIPKVKKLTRTVHGDLIFGEQKNKLIAKIHYDQAEVLVEENKDNISYLFTPSFSKNGSFAFKARLGSPGMWSDDRPDQIRLVKDNKLVIVAEDIHSNSNSKWIGLRNSVTINDKNEVCYFGINSDGKVSLMLFKNNKHYEIVKEGALGIAKLDYFSAVMNNTGLIAFRATDYLGQSVIFLSDGVEVKKILTQNDFITRNNEVFKLSYGPHIPFGGNIGLNNLGDLVINSGLSSKDGKKDRGRGIITIFTKEKSL